MNNVLKINSPLLEGTTKDRDVIEPVAEKIIPLLDGLTFQQVLLTLESVEDKIKYLCPIKSQHSPS